jgi:hypothetical protein
MTYYRITKLIISSSLIWIFYRLFYFQAVQKLDSDFIAHINRIDPIISGEYYFPHSFFHYIVHYTTNLVSFFLENTNHVHLGFCIVILFIFLLIEVVEKIIQKTCPKTNKVSAYLWSIAMLFPVAIYVQPFNENIYLGQWSPNTWHSPTMFMVKPLALISFYLVIKIIGNRINNPFDRTPILCSFMLMISIWAKPSFAISFIPATVLFYFLFRKKDKIKVATIFLILIPGTVLLGYFYLKTYYFTLSATSDMKDNIIIDLFGVTSLYTENVFISLLLAIAFPLSILLADYKKVLKNKYLILGWLNVVIAYGLSILFAEKYKFDQAAFAFGYGVALFILFVFSTTYFINNFNQERKLTRKGLFLMTIFSLHFLSGIFYLYRYFTQGVYN